MCDSLWSLIVVVIKVVKINKKGRLSCLNVLSRNNSGDYYNKCRGWKVLMMYCTIQVLFIDKTNQRIYVVIITNIYSDLILY